MSRVSRIRGFAIAAVLASAGLTIPLTSPSSADAGHAGHAGHATVAEQADPGCGPDQRALRRAGDRFAQGCLPGDRLAQLDDSDAELEPGETASQGMTLLANIPKNGAFADEGSFSSDIAFQGDYAYAGNYNGFTVYDISVPAAPVQVAQVICPGSQNDVSIYRDLLVLSTDSSRSDDSCSSTALSAREKAAWEGVKVFDISNPAEPAYVSAVETKCGSHTHTLAPSKDGEDLFVYVSSYSPNAAYPDCQPPHDLISIVQVPMDDPAAARLAAEPVLFPDGGNPAATAPPRRAGATTSRPTPARTSPPAPAWATVC